MTQPPTPAEPSSTELTQDHHGATVPARLGQPITIRLPQSGGTAYLWHLAQPDRPDLEVVADHVGDAGTAPGAAGTRQITVVPRTPGRWTVRLDRHRPWEGADQADAEFEVVLEVSEGPGLT